MTLISSLILDAYRESNIIALSAVPSDPQNTEALRLYNALISGIYGTDVGENLADWPLGDYGVDPNNYCPPIAQTLRIIQNPPINSRLIAINQVAITIDLTRKPQDGARYAILDPYGRLATYPVTLLGNGRTISGLTGVVLNTNGLSREWLYRADLGDWVQLTQKLLTDDNPFPAEFDNLWIVLLAMRLNPRYGRALTDMSQTILAGQRRNFIARYINSQPLQVDDSVSWPYMSKQGYDTQRSFSSQGAFNRGDYYG